MFVAAVLKVFGIFRLHDLDYVLPIDLTIELDFEGVAMLACQIKVARFVGLQIYSFEFLRVENYLKYFSVLLIQFFH